MGRGRNRRRADGAAGDGTEPGRRRRAINGALLALALATIWGGGLGGYRCVTRSEALRIRAIRYEGLSHATAAELNEISPVKPGDNLLAADLAAMEQALGRDGWVKEAVARRRLWPPEIAVRVRERQPAALVDLGGLYLVDREARVFKRATPGDGLDLPIVTGFTRDDFIQRRGEVEAAVAGALALLDDYARERLESLAPVSEVHVDRDQGVTLYVGDGTQVRLGTGDLPQKLGRLARTLTALGPEARNVEVLHLDNRTHPSWVTVRMTGSREAARAAGSKVAGRTGPRGP